MQCRECGFDIASPAFFCPSCGARLVAADPKGSAPQGGVQSFSTFHGPDATQAQPIVPDAVRPPRPAAPSQAIGSPARAGIGSAPAPAPAKSAPAVPPAPVSVAASAPVDQAPASGVSGSNGAAGGTPVAAGGTPAGILAKTKVHQAGDTLADRYRVEKFLGQGSLSNAYLCRDIRNGNREVVLKAMHARKAAEPGLADSFLFLADNVAKYDHRGIARTYEAGRLGESPYYAMEWVSGMPLRMWLMERLTFENRVLPGLGIVRSLIDIFEAIHERGCYGSLKPENIFVGLGGPVVMDFGVVGFLTSQEFEFNSYARRYLPYMAPELRQDWSNLVPHTDYYSLGAILYEILAGRAPTSPLRLPSELSDLFGIEADEIILKSMAPKPLDRFGTLEAFRSAVSSLQAALLGSQRLPGDDGNRARRVATDAGTVHNPDLTFAVATGSPAPLQDPSYLQVQVPAPGEAAGPVDGNAWTREAPAAPTPAAPPIPSAPEANPYEAAPAPEAPDAVRSNFTGLDSPRDGEAAHALRRFTHSPRSAFPDGELPAPPIPGAAGEGQALPAAGSWESLSGNPDPEQSTVPEESEPVPAWLWISIALAGCSMVVLSAYFGLLLPQQ